MVHLQLGVMNHNVKIIRATVVSIGHQFSVAQAPDGEQYMLYPDSEVWVEPNRLNSEPFLGEFREGPSNVVVIGDEVVLLPGFRKEGTRMTPAKKWAFAVNYDVCQADIKAQEAERQERQATMRFRIVGMPPFGGQQQEVTQGTMVEVRAHLGHHKIDLSEWTLVKWYQMRGGEWKMCPIPRPFRPGGHQQSGANGNGRGHDHTTGANGNRNGNNHTGTNGSNGAKVTEWEPSRASHADTGANGNGANGSGSGAGDQVAHEATGHDESPVVETETDLVSVGGEPTPAEVAETAPTVELTDEETAVAEAKARELAEQAQRRLIEEQQAFEAFQWTVPGNQGAKHGGDFGRNRERLDGKRRSQGSRKGLKGRGGRAAQKAMMALA